MSYASQPGSYLKNKISRLDPSFQILVTDGRQKCRKARKSPENVQQCQICTILCIQMKNVDEALVMAIVK
jgi:hypothetical protein